MSRKDRDQQPLWREKEISQDLHLQGKGKTSSDGLLDGVYRGFGLLSCLCPRSLCVCADCCKQIAQWVRTSTSLASILEAVSKGSSVSVLFSGPPESDKGSGSCQSGSQITTDRGQGRHQTSLWPSQSVSLCLLPLLLGFSSLALSPSCRPSRGCLAGAFAWTTHAT